METNAKPPMGPGLRLVTEDIERIHAALTAHGVGPGRMSSRVRELCELDRATALALADAREKHRDAELRVQELELALDHVAAVAIEASTWRAKPWKALRAVARLALATQPLPAVTR